MLDHRCSSRKTLKTGRYFPGLVDIDAAGHCLKDSIPLCSCVLAVQPVQVCRNICAYATGSSPSLSGVAESPTVAKRKRFSSIRRALRVRTSSVTVLFEIKIVTLQAHTTYLSGSLR